MIEVTRKKDSTLTPMSAARLGRFSQPAQGATGAGFFSPQQYSHERERQKNNLQFSHVICTPPMLTIWPVTLPRGNADSPSRKFLRLSSSR